MKKKDYLSQNERTHYLFLNSLLWRVEDILAELQRHKPEEKAMLRFFRTGLTWIGKGMREWVKPVDPKVVQTLEKEAQMFRVSLIHHRETQAHVTRMEKEHREQRLKAQEELGPDPIGDMAELLLLSYCQKCDGTIKNTCHLYPIFEAFDIPDWSTRPECRYAEAGLLQETV